MNDKKQIFAWAMYDWANSAYATTVLVAILPVYFATGIVGEEGADIFGTRVQGDALWGFLLSVAALIAFIMAPVLGSIADFSVAKKKFLQVFCFAGSSGAILLFLCGSGDVWMSIVFFLIAQVGFVGGNVFYDAFLPQISSEDKMDWVSAKGYAYGYIGGGVQFGLSLGIYSMRESLGMDEAMAARTVMAFAGLWWLSFALLSFAKLRESGRAEELPEEYRGRSHWWALLLIGFKRTWATTKKVRRFRHLLIFLIAFLIYNDGIQTAITQASLFGKKQLNLDTPTLMITLLIIQFVSFFGSLLFGWLGEKIGSKTALILSLLGWSGVVIYAYFMQSATEYFALGVVVGLVMGGSQSLSRSMFGSMIPANASAEFYGFYSVFNKFSTIWGSLVFAIITHFTGDSRNAIISLVLFFVIGIILLYFVNLAKARQAKLEGAF